VCNLDGLVERLAGSLLVVLALLTVLVTAVWTARLPLF
jgi:hypothetical protein